MLIEQIDIEKEFLSFKDQLESYLYRLSANREDAQDLLHDTYVKVQQKIGTFKGKSGFKTWVFSIATNLARDNQRVKNRWSLDALDKCRQAAESNQHYHDSIVNAFQNQTEQTFQMVEHINYCFTCIAKNLSLEKQIAIILKEFYHFRRKEITEIVGKTEGFVKHLLFEGRNELQEKYDHRCALINKKGICYQCAELNDYLSPKPDSKEKIEMLEFIKSNNPEEQLGIRFQLINQINPLKSNGSALEDVILQILRQAINDE